MGQLLDALKRLETRSPAVGTNPAAEQDAARRHELQMAQILVDVESAVTQLAGEATPGLAPSPAVLSPPPPPLPIREFPQEEPFTGAASDVFSEIARYLCGQLPPGQPSALFFTSPQDGEGKTETLMGLIPALPAQGAGRILMVDANFRRPTLTRRWAALRGAGLGEVLWAVADWDDAIQPSVAPGVDLLPNFGLPRNLHPAAEPLGFDSLLNELRQAYPLVVVDAASLAHPETAVLAATCDGVYLVVRLGRDTRSAVSSAVDILAQSGGELWGCVAVEG
jgi:Mrp family chromosome partitioning ATPase